MTPFALFAILAMLSVVASHTSKLRSQEIGWGWAAIGFVVLAFVSAIF